MASFRLQFSCSRMNRRAHRETCLPASLALCLATLCASFQLPPGPSHGLSLGYQTSIHLVMTAIRLQISCKWTKRRATWSIVALPPWQCCLPTLSASLQSPPSHWPSLPYDVFISSGLRALYRSPLGGLPISPALTMFNSPVNQLSRSLNRDSERGNRYPRLCPRSQDYVGISFALPGMGTRSRLTMIRITELHTFGYHICPDVGETCCGAGEDLVECIGVLQVPIKHDYGHFIISGAVAFVAT